MAKVKIPGFNFLHTHPSMEKKYNIPENHVIVDRKDWEESVEILRKKLLP